MSPLNALHSLQELRLSRLLQTLLLVSRFLIAGLVGWSLYSTPEFSTFYTNKCTYISLGIYASVALLTYILVLFRPTNRSISLLGTILDTIFGISLLFLLPNQASISVVLALGFIFTVLADVRLPVLLTLNIIYLIAAISAGWYYNTLEQAELNSSHIISIIITMLGYLYYLKANSFKHQADLKDSLNLTILQKKHLMDGLFYLFPFHQRNQIPMSLLVIRISQQYKNPKLIPQQLIQLYKTRLRKCDLLVQINQQHIAVLLCDTTIDQASRYVVQALKQLKNGSPLHDIYLTYAIAKLPLDQELAIDDVLQQAMQSLQEAEYQKVDRVVFISAKQSD